MKTLKLLQTSTGMVHLAKSARMLNCTMPVPRCSGGGIVKHSGSVAEFDGEASEVTCKKCLSKAEALAAAKAAKESA